MTDESVLVETSRISTGEPQADEVLHGGFPAHSINIVMGEPGTGKTIFAQQLLFHNAGGDRPAVYLSTLSEPLAKVLTYLQGFRFYDETMMLDAVVYEDIGDAILENGVGCVLDKVGAVIRQQRPTLLVIDSFKAIHDLARDPSEMRRLSAELGGLLAAYDVTTFLIGEYASDQVATYPEFAVADGIVQLARHGSEKSDERYLRVLKLRGSDYEEGLHAFTITRSGLEVYPRLVTPRTPPSYELAAERVTTGVPGLDGLIEGGFWRGSSTLVVGPTGAGKTTFGLGFALEGVREGEPSLYVNFQENPTQLGRTIRRMGVDLDASVRHGLRLQYASPVELKIDAVVVELFRTVHEHGIRRVVIDGLRDLRLAAPSHERFHDYIYATGQQFAERGITSVLTLETHHTPDWPRVGPEEARLSAISDTLISLATDLDADPPRRRLRIVKARGSAHPLEPVPFTITSRGLELGGREQP
ncbi:MAG: RAD55 family ATPase [Gemmatimonadota bacterium]